MLEHGAAGYVDVAFHPYVRTAPQENPGPVSGALVDKVRAFMAARGAGEEPLWITEVGISTVAKPPKTEQQQADGLVSILGQMQERGIPVTIVHRLVDEVRSDFPSRRVSAWSPPTTAPASPPTARSPPGGESPAARSPAACRVPGAGHRVAVSAATLHDPMALLSRKKKADADRPPVPFIVGVGRSARRCCGSCSMPIPS